MKPGQLALLSLVGLAAVVFVRSQQAAAPTAATPAAVPAPRGNPGTASKPGKGPARRQAAGVGILAFVGGGLQALGSSGALGGGSGE